MMKKIVLLLLLILFSVFIAHSQVITTKTDTTYKAVIQSITHDTTIKVKDSTLISATCYKDTTYKKRTWRGTYRTVTKQIAYDCSYWSFGYHDSVIQTPPHDTTIMKTVLVTSVDTVYVTKFGLLLNNKNATAPWNKPSLAKDSLHVLMARDAVNLAVWNGSDKPVEDYINYGLQLFLNINYKTCTTQPCPFLSGDLTNYTALATQVITKYKNAVKVIAVENEPFNQNYFTGPRSDYNKLLIACAKVAHSNGVKVTDGGLYAATLKTLTYRWLKRTGQTAALDSFKVCMPAGQIKNAETPGYNAKLEGQVQDDSSTIMVDKVYCDYVNIHIYYDSTDITQHLPQTDVAIKYIQKYVKAVTGLELTSNENGVRNNNDPNTSPTAVVGLLQIMEKYNLPHSIQFSGNWGEAGSQGYVNDDGTIKNGDGTGSGDAYGQYMLDHPRVY